MRLWSRTSICTCATLAVLLIGISMAAADDAAIARARAALAAAKAAEDAASTERNERAVDRALAALNATLNASSLGRLTAPANVGDTEPNNTAATATPLSFGLNPSATATATIGVNGDVDYFSFTAPASARIWAYVDTGGTQVGTSVDSVLQLVTNDGVIDTELELDDSDGTGNGLNGT